MTIMSFINPFPQLQLSMFHSKYDLSLWWTNFESSKIIPCYAYSHNNRSIFGFNLGCTIKHTTLIQYQNSECFQHNCRWLSWLLLLLWLHLSAVPTAIGFVRVYAHRAPVIMPHSTVDKSIFASYVRAIIAKRILLSRTTMKWAQLNHNHSNYTAAFFPF